MGPPERLTVAHTPTSKRSQLSRSRTLKGHFGLAEALSPRFQAPNVSYIPKTIMTMPKTETTDTLHLGTLDP